jgi:thiol-disulfide isomerase/thioredoxin
MSETRTRRELLAVLAGTVALAGCVGGDQSAGTTPDDGASQDEETPSDEDGGWQTATLEDVTTGESFTIQQFDRPVLVHTFATWCPTCRGQQQEIKRYLDDAGDSVVAVDLTIDENDNPKKLRQHAESNDFGWRFGVAPGDMTGAMVEEFGRNVAVAPRSPVILVCPDGRAQTLGQGLSASDIAAAVEEHC